MKKILTSIFATFFGFAMLTVSISGWAQQVAKMTPFGRGYLEYLPPGYSTSTETYPCLIFLHGSGERGLGTPADLAKIPVSGPPKHIKNGHKMCFTVNGKSECFIVLSPQTIKWSWRYDVMPFVKYAMATYRIDPQRIYVTGLSMGGEGTWLAASLEDNVPNYFAAIAPMAGRAAGTDGCNVANKSIPVWCFHGDADKSIPLAADQRVINGMLSCGANPKPIFTIYAGVGHGGTWDRGYRTDHTYHNPNVYEWLLSHKLGTPTKQPPVVNAGTDKTITLPVSTTTLAGTATDIDGTIASTVWTQVSGPNTAGIVSASSLSTQLNGLIAGNYTFSLTATDNDGLPSTDQVIVKVNPAPPQFPPVANAGIDKSITLPVNTISLTGSGTDSDGTIASRLWTQDSGPNTATLSGATTNTLNASNLIVGSYTFSFTVTDNDGLKGTDQVTVVVLAAPPNAPPVVIAGADKSITLPTSSTGLTGSATDADGTIATYLWTQSSGPSTATILPTNQAITAVSALVEGVYVFTLTATDDKGTTGSDQIIVTVFPEPPNALPTANAGTDISMTLPVNSTTLTGSGNDSDGTITNYAWVQTSGPSIASMSNPFSGVNGLTGLQEGNYLFTLTVTDERGGEGSDQVLVMVLPVPPNQPPVANAGTDINITLPVNSIQFNGNGTDTDGTIAQYEWVQQSGPTVAQIVNPAANNSQVNNLGEGVYTFKLTVTDDKGATGSDLIVVNVFPPANVPPTASAGTDIAITLPTNSTPLSGSGADTDGTISTYLWEQVSGPSAASFSDAASPSPTVSSLLTAGIYTFSITVTDNDGAKDTDEINVTVSPEPPNLPPVANAGSDIALTLPTNTATLNGTGTDADGTIVGYHWNFISGPSSITLSDPEQQNLTVSDLVEGIFVFELVVVDNRGATATDEVKIAVDALNQPPIANAGVDKTITLPVNAVILTGTGTDPDGTIASYKWEQVSGPNTATVNNFNVAQITPSNLIQGIYTFGVRVTDNEGLSDYDEVTVLVNPAPPNNPPVADAGPDLEITLPVNSVSINGTCTDSDGTVTIYKWTKVSGPATFTSPNVNQASVTYSNLVAGTYVFRLTVTDNAGAKGQNDVQVKVNPQPVNIPPVANAGSDEEITLPINNVTLTGLGSDIDGSIASYQWLQTNGPAPADLPTPTSTSTQANNLVEGIYVFQLTVTDDDGVTAFDEVTITVKPIPANLPPIADAGGNKVITLPINSTSLSGSATDDDGLIVSHNWVQISGPSILTPPDFTAQTLVLSNLIEGIYLFRLTVTDDDGSTGFDEVNVRVQPVPANQPPTADAGTNKLITLPTSSTSFDGSESTDPEGPIASYDWTQVSGPSTATTTGLTSNVLSVADLLEGTYIFKLTVKDSQGAEGFDEVNVRVSPVPPNFPPQAIPGNDLSITLPIDIVKIDGAGTDSDGTVATYSWTQTSGPSTAVFEDEDKASVIAKDLVEGIYTFRLTVTDDDGESTFDEMTVTVNPEPANNAPVVNAGADQWIILPPDMTTLQGSVTDTDGTIASTLWTQISGLNAPINDASALSTTVNDLAPGTYIFRLTATDDDGDTGFDEVVVEVKDNLSPIAFAGDSIKIDTPEDSTQLQGGGSDPDGTIASYAWSQVSGPNTPQVSDPSQPILTLEGLVQGKYVFGLTVIDDKGATGYAEVVVVIDPAEENVLPVADAGQDTTLILPVNTVVLEGSGTDADGTIASYAWNQVSGPNTAEISDPSQPTITLEGLVLGEYVFGLTVTDDKGASGYAEVVVTIAPPVEENVLPVADAGQDTTLILPVNTVVLEGSGTDADGTISGYSWIRLSGPGSASIDDPALPTISVSDLTEGSHIFELTVTDNKGATGTDAVTVTVLPELELDKFIFPKVFSPNGDGNNDVWIWQNPQLFEGCLLTIYNRFGKKVFESESYNNDWNGTSGGIALEAEAYYFVIKCSKGQTTGGVRIVR